MKFEKSVNFNYDSVMINEEYLNFGTHRLLEVNNRLLVPIGLPIKFLITSTDVLHS
jgi:cytochrome c oxidase subunit 2